MENEEAPALRARVFISCGQRKNSDEVSIVSEIQDRLCTLGFDPYVAVQEQTLRGLKENLFEQLSKSEYFVFVDFKREALDSSSIHRGSLFCHQELAIASYLDIPVLAFQESGVKTDDGILRFIQANALSFSDRHLLPNLIANEVNKRKQTWDPRWRNELVLERDPKQYSLSRLPDGTLSRFFHIGVHNRHRNKTARNCCAYLVKATRADTNTGIPVKQVELRWAGYDQPNAYIFPKRVRPFDGFYIREDLPTCLQFNLFATGTDFIPNIAGEGSYELEYLVVSENFPEARTSLVLTLAPSLDATSLVPTHYRK